MRTPSRCSIGLLALLAMATAAHAQNEPVRPAFGKYHCRTYGGVVTDRAGHAGVAQASGEFDIVLDESWDDWEKTEGIVGVFKRKKDGIYQDFRSNRQIITLQTIADNAPDYSTDAECKLVR